MRSFEASWYDGRTSRPTEVKVYLEDGGAIRIVGEGVDLGLSRSELRPAARLGDTPRSIALPDGQKLETLDNDAVDVLARMGGRRASLAWVQRLEGSWPPVLASIAVLLIVLAVGAFWGIPLGARVVAEMIPDDLAHAVGKDTLDVLDRTAFEASDLAEADRDRVQRSFEDLAALHPELPLRLELRSMGGPNAFALPDGTVVVTDELIALAENDDELASVIAHEIGHVHHRHGLRMVLESSTVALLISAYLGDVAQVSSILATLPAVLSQAGYSRAHETEADEFALELMSRAGVESHHFANILRKLKDAAGAESGGAFQYLSSHPPTDERIARAAGD